MFQPTHPAAKTLGKECRVVLPSEVDTTLTPANDEAGLIKLPEKDGLEALMDGKHANGQNGMEGGGDGGAIASKGVRPGPHWFEVVPQNMLQHELTKLSVK